MVTTLREEKQTMMIPDREFLVQKIRSQYTEKEQTDLDELKALDKKVKKPADVFAYVFGSIAAIVMGMVTDLLINHFLRFTEKLPGGSKRWIMVTRRGAAGFFLNVLYGFVLMFLVVTAYNVINAGIVILYNGSETAPLLHVEPLFFGLAAMGADTLCVACRNLLRKIVADAKKA